MQPFPHPSDATHKIWSRLAKWLLRYSSLKVWTTDDDGRRRTPTDADGRRRTDDGPLLYYKLTLWAFGSGELKMRVCPAKTQISLDIRPVCSESSLSAWRKLGSLTTHWAQSEDSEQTWQMPRLISVFAGRILILLVCHVAAHTIIYVIILYNPTWIGNFAQKS